MGSRIQIYQARQSQTGGLPFYQSRKFKSSLLPTSGFNTGGQIQTIFISWCSWCCLADTSCQLTSKRHFWPCRICRNRCHVETSCQLTSTIHFWYSRGHCCLIIMSQGQHRKERCSFQRLQGNQLDSNFLLRTQSRQRVK